MLLRSGARAAALVIDLTGEDEPSPSALVTGQQATRRSLKLARRAAINRSRAQAPSPPALEVEGRSSDSFQVLTTRVLRGPSEGYLSLSAEIPELERTACSSQPERAARLEDVKKTKLARAGKKKKATYTMNGSHFSTDERISWVETQLLHYHFKDKSLLREALTHNYVRGAKDDGFLRLALLGDGVLYAIVRTAWYYTGHSRGAEATAGIMTNANLAQVCTTSGLLDRMICKSSLTSNVSTWIAAGLLEAVIGAIWIDCNYDHGTMQAILQRLGLGY